MTFMVAFAVMASGITSAGALAKAFAGDYFAQFMDAPELGVALVFFAVVMVVNLIGISESVKANAAFTIIEVTGLIIIVVIGVFALGGGDAYPGRALEFKAGSSPLALIIAGTTLAFYAFTSITQNEADIYLRAGILLAIGLVFWVINGIANGPMDKEMTAEAFST